MKNLSFLIFLLAVLFQHVLYAQSPNSFRYQAVIRDNQNNPIDDADKVDIKIRIIKNSPEGDLVYCETHFDVPHPGGVTALYVGKGEACDFSPTFESIKWNASAHYLDISLSRNGSQFVTIGSPTQLVSVPYALYGQDEDASPTNEFQTISKSGSTVTLSDKGGSFSINDADASPTNEIQTLSVDNDKVTISKGNVVTIPRRWNSGSFVLANDQTTKTINHGLGVRPRKLTLQVVETTNVGEPLWSSCNWIDIDQNGQGQSFITYRQRSTEDRVRVFQKSNTDEVVYLSYYNLVSSKWYTRIYTIETNTSNITIKTDGSGIFYSDFAVHWVAEY